VGAGNLSSRKIYPLIGTAGAQLVGVCDIDKAKAEKNASLWGGKVYTDMENMLDIEKPDAVIICISAQMHAKLAAIAMRKGIPVYTEKPPAESASSALELAKISKETGILCSTAEFAKLIGVKVVIFKAKTKNYIYQEPKNSLR